MKKSKTREFAISINIAILLSVMLAITLVSCDNDATKPDPPDPTGTVMINITTSDGGSVDGATVVLQNHVDGEYQQTATSSTVVFTDIPFGLYSVIISHLGYHPFIDEVLTIQNHNVSHTVYLIDTRPQIGDYITFGTYTWRVLDIQEDRALIVSEHIIEQRVYHNINSTITWAECSLRDYLNSDFYNSSVFSNEDRSKIVQITNVNEDNQWYGTPGGENTQDKIFLLSIAEVVQYFGDSGQLANPDSTPYWWAIIDQFNINRIATFNGVATWWWLRSPGEYGNRASDVGSDGHINLDGEWASPDYYHIGVRPALWLNL